MYRKQHVKLQRSRICFVSHPLSFPILVLSIYLLQISLVASNAPVLNLLKKSIICERDDDHRTRQKSGHILYIFSSWHLLVLLSSENG
ncbi:hypothetical protein [Psychrobacillus sp. L4]|uniref:hypothetical protein n=1 Tax=Psychrobacillus sp. L4 TaxID=3236892 RepID=UPI0036F31C29